MSKIDADRQYWIDAIRSFACICVVAVHAPIPGGQGGAFNGPFNYFTAAGASILFFMISGALVLYKPKPVIPFLKKRVTRIVFPMFFWSVISLLFFWWRGDFSGSEFFQRVLRIPFYEQVGTYWFIYVIFGIYLVTPIVASWLERCQRRELEFYLIIWAITLCLPYLKLLDDDIDMMVDFGHGSLYYFYGFLWFAVMGYYLRKYVNISRFKWWHVAIFAAVVILPLLLYQTRIPHNVIQYRMSINLVALCICYFIIIKHIPLSDRWKRICYNFAQHSFGIYLVHILVKGIILKPVLLMMLDYPYAITTPVVTVMNVVISYLIVELISKLPGSKYIVGL